MSLSPTVCVFPCFLLYACLSLYICLCLSHSRNINGLSILYPKGMKHTVDIRRTCNKYKRNLLNAYTSKKYKTCFESKKKIIYIKKKGVGTCSLTWKLTLYIQDSHTDNHTHEYSSFTPPPFLDTNSHLETHAA